MNEAMTTLAPTDNPTKEFTNKLIIGPLAPTAAKAPLPAKLPTTATSAALNNCCKILLAAKGSAKSISLFQMEPFNISNVFFFFILSLHYVLFYFFF